MCHLNSFFVLWFFSFFYTFFYISSFISIYYFFIFPFLYFCIFYFLFTFFTKASSILQPPPLYTILKLRMSYILVISLQFPPPLVHSISPHSNLFIFLFDIQFKQANQAYLFTIAEISLDYGLYFDTGCLRKVLSLWDLYSVPGCLRNISR